MHLADTFRQRDFSSVVFFTFKFIYIQYAQLKNIFKKYLQWIYILFALLPRVFFFKVYILWYSFCLFFLLFKLKQKTRRQKENEGQEEKKTKKKNLTFYKGYDQKPTCPCSLTYSSSQWSTESDWAVFVHGS